MLAQASGGRAHLIDRVRNAALDIAARSLAGRARLALAPAPAERALELGLKRLDLGAGALEATQVAVVLSLLAQRLELGEPRERAHFPPAPEMVLASWPTALRAPPMNTISMVSRTSVAR